MKEVEKEPEMARRQRIWVNLCVVVDRQMGVVVDRQMGGRWDREGRGQTLRSRFGERDWG